MIRSPYRELEKAIGYRFKNKKRLATALAHPSISHEQDLDLMEASNQRLEFLGDAALGLVSAWRIYTDYPELPEGDMTKTRSNIVSTKALAAIGRSIGLGDHLQLGRGEEGSGGRDRKSNLADAMEAIIGAAYLDGGLKAVQKIFDQLFRARLDAMEDPHVENAKGMLQEFIQKRDKISPTYRIVEESGPAHARTFTAEVVVNEEVLGRGSGMSKRTAEMSAAKHALAALQEG